MKSRLTSFFRLAAAFSISVFCFPAGAVEPQEGAVVQVHSAAATNAFLASLGLPLGRVPTTRLAVVRVVERASGDASFILVWVPDYLSLRADDRVEFAPNGEDAAVNPSSGVVTRVSPTLASVR
jgi:hypothetical protein